MNMGDIETANLVRITRSLKLIPSDISLSRFEENLSSEWLNAMNSTNHYQPFRILTAFSTILQKGAEAMDASIILADLGPNLGAINRSAMIATDYVIVPLGADIFSLQGLHNLGPTLKSWREYWKQMRKNWRQPQFPLPFGTTMIEQHSFQLRKGHVISIVLYTNNA